MLGRLSTSSQHDVNPTLRHLTEATGAPQRISILYGQWPRGEKNVAFEITGELNHEFDQGVPALGLERLSQI